MYRELLLGVVFVAATVSGAHAEAWYVVSATPAAATILDSDSRTTDGVVYVTTRVVHPGIELVRGAPVIASQFREEFDCKANRFRVVAFALIDLDGRVPPGFSTDKIREWSTVEDGSPGAAIKNYACSGVLPTKASGPYRDFTDFEANYLMWVGGKTSKLEGPRR